MEPERTPDPGFASRHPFLRRKPPPLLSALSELARPRLILASARAPAASAARRLHGPGAPALRPALGASPGRLLARHCSPQFPGAGMQMLPLVLVGAAAAATGFSRTGRCLRSRSCRCCRL